jgi:hypothetical protein
MYGALTKQIESNSLLSPGPVGLSYKQLVQKVFVIPVTAMVWSALAIFKL